MAKKQSYQDKLYKVGKATTLKKKIDLPTLADDINKINKSISDTYNGWQSKETLANTKRSIEGIQSRIKAYEEYKKSYADSTLDLPDLSKIKGAYSDALSGWGELTDKYKNYKNADAYNKSVKEYEGMTTADLGKVKTEIKTLEGYEKKAKEYLSQMGSTGSSSISGGGVASMVAQNKLQAELDKYLDSIGYKSYDDLKKALGNKKVYLNNASRLQEGIKLGSVGDIDSEFYDPNYEKYVAKGKTIDPQKVGTSKTSTVVPGRTTAYKTTTKSANRYAAEALQAHLKGEKIKATNYYDEDAVYALMEESEFDNVAYYLAKDQEDGGNRTEQYVESIKESLNQRRGKEIAESIDGTWRQGVFAITAGLDQFSTGLTNAFSDADYIPANQIQSASSEIREDIYEDNGWWARAGYDLANTTANMLPSILMSSVANYAIPGSGAVVGAALMGVSASGNAYQEMVNLGYDKDQARAYQMLVGASEAGLQYALGGIGKFGGTSKWLSKAVTGIDNGLARFAIRWGGSMLSEGFEEAAQEVLTPIFMDIAAGYDTGSKIDWSEVAYSGLLGALSGGFMEGPGVATNMATEHHSNKIAGQNIKDNARADSVFKMAEFSPEESLAYEAYTKYAKKGINAENISDARLGRLAMLEGMDAQEVLDSKSSTAEERKAAHKKNFKLDEYSKYNPEARAKAVREKTFNDAIDKETKSSSMSAEEVKTKVKERLTELGEENNADEVADLIAKRLGSGEKITSDEISAIEKSDYGARVFKETISDGAGYTEGMSKAEAELFWNNYNIGEDVEAYATSFNLMKEYANHPDGFTADYVLENKGSLSAEAATNIYNSLYHIADAEQSEKMNNQLKELAKKNKGKAGVINDSIMNYGDKYIAGKVNWKALSRKQKQAFIYTKGIFQALGSNVVFVGKNKDFNGAYSVKGDTIYIDVYAGVDLASGKGKDVILNTVSHEITHQMRIKAHDMWKHMSKLVLEGLEKSMGKTRNELIAEKIERLKGQGHDHTEDDAIDEIVARACEGMLLESKEAKAMVESLSAEEQSKLVSIIKSIIEKITNWIDELLKLYDPHSAEAKALKEDKERYEAMSIMWDNMLREVQKQNKAIMESATEESSSDVDAVENVSDDGEITSIGSYDLTELSEAVDEDGKMMFQYRAIEADKDIYREMLLKHKDTIGITNKQINDLFTMIDKAVEIITKDELSLEALDYSWDADINDRAFNPVKPNSDSLYKVSLDFSTLCRKRLLQQTIQTTLQEALNKNLSKEESIAIRDELMKLQEEGRKIEIACALCYVESARMKSPVQINKFLNNKETIIKDFYASKDEATRKKIDEAALKARETLAKRNPKGLKGKNNATLDALTASLNSMYAKDANFIRDAKKAVIAEYKPTEAQSKEIGAALNMSAVDFTSAEGLENLAKKHPDIFDAYTSFVRNDTHSKGLESDVWWRAGDSESIGDNLIAQMNEENGLRSQSWSDFQVIHLLDYIAATIELSTRGAKRQSYTKVPDYVKLLGNTGDMINMSIIPERAFSGKLGFDAVEGMAYEVALKLREEYHKTAGTISIGINDAQIRLLLEDTNIDMVIPYHASGMSKAVKKLMHIPEWESYQSYQSESILKDTEAKANAEKYGVELKTDDKLYHKAPKFSEWFDINEARQIAEYENKNPSNKELKKKYGVMYGGYMAMQNAANTYLKLCAERGLAPKFSHEKADLTNDANYWKLLIDRKMVDNVTGEVIEQQAIKPIFKEESVLEILNDELARYPEVKADQEYAQRVVTEKFLSGDMKMDKSTREAIKKPIDNVTKVNILESAEEGKMKYMLREDAEAEVEQAITDKNYAKEIKLTDSSPSILTSQPGVRNLPMMMVASHVRENILTEAEARALGLTVNINKHYHGLGKPLFLNVVGDLDNVTEAYRGTKNAEKSERRENYFLLISKYKDSNENTINVPVYVNQYGSYNRIVIDTNKVATVFGRDNFKLYIQNEIAKGNLVRIKNRSTQASESTPLIDGDYSKNASKDSITEPDEKVKTKNSTDKIMKMPREESYVYDLMEERDAWVERNKSLNDDFDRFKKRWNIDKATPNGSQIGAVARYILKQSNSKMNSAELEKRLKEAYAYITDALGTDTNLTWGDISDVLYNIANDLTKETEVAQNDYSKVILTELRKTKVSLTESQKEELRSRFGNDWITHFMGKVIISNNAVPIEEQWKVWAKKYPTLFSADTKVADMAIELYNTVGNIKEAGNIISEYEALEKSTELVEEIYNKLWTIIPIKTTVEQDVKKIKKLNFEHRKTIDKAKSINKAVTKADKGRIIKLANEIRERRDRDVTRAKELGKQRLDSFKENAERKTKIQSITATTLSLADMYAKNSKDKHIPEIMKGPVRDIINAINFSSKRLLDKGIPTKKDISLQNALKDIQTMLNESGSALDGGIEMYGTGLSEDIKNMLKDVDALAKKYGDNELILQTMSLDSLKTLDATMKVVRASVNKLNKYHVVQHNAGVEALGVETARDVDDAKKIYKDHKKHFDKLKTKTYWNNLNPYYAFKNLGKHAQKVFKAFMDGQDKIAFLAKEIIDFSESVYTEKEYKGWSKQFFDFEIKQPDGSVKEFKMNVPQIMSLYCVAKQDDAKKHLLHGKFGKDGEIGNGRGITLVETEKTAAVVKNILLTEADLNNIIATLDRAEVGRAKEVADKLQNFMATRGAELGNEISMARWGIKSFGIENYFPIKVSDGQAPEKGDTPGVQGNPLVALLNMSFTHARNHYAPQSIEIGDVFDVFANHMSSMIQYNAMALPVLDMYKWMNTRVTDENGNEISVKTSIKDTFGEYAWNYFNTFLQDVNGSTKADTRDNLGVKFFKNAKVAKVAANIRVVLLQFTSYIRSGAVMDNKYLLRALVHTPKVKKSTDNCGMVLWKSMGYYETDITRPLTDKIKHVQGIKDKMTDWSLKGAEWADKITLGYLWNACELEIRETRKDLQPGTKEFDKEVGLRLREVIYRTQVVDSQLTRSQMMRSKGGWDKVLTTFASESTLSFNLITDLFVSYKLDSRRMGKEAAKQKHSKYIRKAITAYVVTNVVTSMLATMFDAFRDYDEEDKDEKYLLTLMLENMATNSSFINKIPYINLFISTISGFTPSRVETDWMKHSSDFVKEMYKIVAGEGSGEKAFEKLLRALSDATGIAGYNLYRDVRAFIELFN